MSDPYSEDDILNIVGQITNDPPFKDRDSEYENRRDLLYQRRFVSIPGVTVDARGNQRTSMVQFRSPEIEDDAHAFKNRMLASPLKINVTALKKSQKAQDAAQAQEDFFYRHYYRWRDQGIFDPVLFDQASQGIGWCHLSLNTELLPMLPEGDNIDDALDKADEQLQSFTNGEKSDLFVLESIDANTMYWSPDHSIKIQKARIPLNPLVTLYGKRGKQIIVEDDAMSVTTLAPGENVEVFRTNWNQMVTLYTVEDDEYCYHVGGGYGRDCVLGVYRNYFHTPAFFSCIGERTSSSDPLYGYRPLLQGKYQTVPIKNIMVTSMMTGTVEGAQQRWTLRALPGTDPDGESNLSVNVDDNGVVVPPDGYELINAGYQIGPDIPNALKTMQLMDTYGYPKALGNPQEITASSGYDRARIQDAVSSLLDPPLSHFSAMNTEIMKALRAAVAEIGLPITVNTVEKRQTYGGPVAVRAEATINPEDAKEETDISISFNSVSMFSRLSMQEEGLKLMQADEMTETQFQTEVMGTDNLQEWRDERALDKVLKNADERAVAYANQVIDQIADAARQKAVTDNGLPNPAPQNNAMVPTNGEMLRNDRGAGVPLGPGVSIPAGGPTPPAPAELGGTEAPAGVSGIG